MANIKCALWCEHQKKGFCNKIEIDIYDMQYIEEITTPKCFDFDKSKAECYACENCDDVKDVCEIDGHSINETSTCTIGEFSSSF